MILRKKHCLVSHMLMHLCSHTSCIPTQSQLECGTTAQLCDLALRETSKKLLAAHKKKRAQDGIGAAAAWVQARSCMPLLTRTEDKMAFVLYGSSKKMPAAHKFKK